MGTLSSQNAAYIISLGILKNKADELNLYSYHSLTNIVITKLIPKKLTRNKITSHNGKLHLHGHNNNENINYTYINITDNPPLNALNVQLGKGASLGDFFFIIIDTVKPYNGNDETIKLRDSFWQGCITNATKISPFAFGIINRKSISLT